MAAKRKRRLLFVAFLQAVCIASIFPIGAALASTHQIDNRGSDSEADLTTHPPGRSLSLFPSIQADAAQTGGTTTALGGRLVHDGEPDPAVGVNAYELATDWWINAGCGPMLSSAQLNAFFASLPANSLVRFWAFQGSMAINIKTHEIDWAPLDRVFAAAAAHGQRLIVSLTDQGGVCDGDHWQDPSWLEGGFQDVFNSPSNSDGSGHTPLSYWDYMQDIVNRYKDSPALGMWEPISEAEASTCDGSSSRDPCWGHTSCPDESVAAAALRHFFDVVG